MFELNFVPNYVIQRQLIGLTLQIVRQIFLVMVKIVQKSLEKIEFVINIMNTRIVLNHI